MAKIELPDLESQTDVEIVKENLHAAQAIYFAYQLEEMRLFQVVERIVELFQQGQLPLGRGGAGQMLEQYWRSHRPQPESVRRNAYWRMFGVAPGGDARAGEPNSEFLSLWMRFIFAVSAYAREHSAAALITPPRRPMRACETPRAILRRIYRQRVGWCALRGRAVIS